ncbi:MAG: hypothetical protein ACK4WH_05375 [Phycisphaerales bacterium]
MLHGLEQAACGDPLFPTCPEPARDLAPTMRIRVRAALLDLPPPIG